MASVRHQNLLDAGDTSALLLITNSNSNEVVSSHEVTYNNSKNVKVKKKQFVKRFREEWLDNPLFAGWLQSIPSTPEKCLCSVCGVVLYAGKSELEKHAAGKKHCINRNAMLMRDQPVKKSPVDVLNSSQNARSDDMLGNVNYITSANMSVQFQQEKKSILPKVVKLQTDMRIKRPLDEADAEEKPAFKRKTVVNPHITQHNLSLPEKPDPAKLIRLLTTEPDDDEFDEEEEEEEEEEDFDDPLPSSQQVLREMKAELAYSEKKLIEEKQKEALSLHDFDEANRPLSEKELEARLNLIEEKRRQQFNIYKLRLLEMKAKVKLAEAEVKRAEELHQLRTNYLQFQIQRQQDEYMGPIADVDLESAADTVK